MRLTDDAFKLAALVVASRPRHYYPASDRDDSQCMLELVAACQETLNLAQKEAADFIVESEDAARRAEKEKRSGKA